MEKTTLLLVDDEPAQREILAGYLKKKGHRIFQAGSVAQAILIFKENPIDAVLTDYRMPDSNGMELLTSLCEIRPAIAVVLMTAYGTIENAVAAMRKGAFDYLTKPINLEELDILLQRIMERQHLIVENQILKEHLAEKYSFSGIVSRSTALEQVLNIASRVARSDASILVRGESGTGKEVIAKAIHFASGRAAHPFIAVNCAALNEQLLESELFGHERGAFTGADRQRRGRFEIAEGGTIFLDEIGDISPGAQVRLLRVLQERQFERVGGSETLTVSVRVIAATNKNLEQSIVSGTFREDLFYRLNVISIEIPPLRSRRDDIEPLLHHFLDMFAEKNNKHGIMFSKEAWEALLRYDYPGNVRELENIVQRAVIFSRGDYITVRDLPPNIVSTHNETLDPVSLMNGTLPEAVTRIETMMIDQALQESGGNQSKAALRLGISERTLRYQLKKRK
ncbi:MAG TPA: sigma-54 dependent transcriptional regulator [Bacteroidota bacterium]|nr:sigma-54 dependent transcriptional regulator [Bacteroidota bacterium]